MKFTPHEYQKKAIRHILDHPRCGLFLDMGLGKTVSALTAASALVDAMEVSRVLVIAPKSVAENTWSSECSKWKLEKTRARDPLQRLHLTPRYENTLTPLNEIKLTPTEKTLQGIFL